MEKQNLQIGTPSGSDNKLHTLFHKHKFTGLAVVAMSLVLCLATALAATTSNLYPTANGNYTDWNSPGSFSSIDETGTEVCNSSDYVLSTATNDRSSFTVDLSSIPNGSTITAVGVTTGNRGDSSAGGTFRSFIRLNGTDTDAASNLSAVGTSGSTCTDNTQNFTGLSTVKAGGTTLEIGVLKTSTNTNAVRVGAMHAVVTYTAVTPPTGSSAVVQNSTATSVDLVVTGANFSTFVNSGTATANATDRANITYRSANPTAAVINNATTMTLTFPISIGTDKSGSLTIAADTVQDGSSTHNALITIINTSITDSANPVLTAVVKSFTSSRNRLSFTYSEPITVTNGASTTTKGNTTTAGTVAGFGSFATTGNVTVPTTKNTVGGNGTSTITIDLADQSAGFMNTGSTTEPSGVFTPVASSQVQDSASNQVNTGVTQTVSGGGTWDLTKPTISSVTISDAANNNGRVDRAVMVLSESMRDSNITNGNALLGGVGHTGVFTTGTSNDNTTTFNLSSDTLSVDTSPTAAQFTYSGATTSITDLAGNLLDTATDGQIANGDVVETDGAKPIMTAVAKSLSSGKNRLSFTYSEPVTVTNGASTTTKGDITTAGTVAGFGGFATAGNTTVPTTKNTVGGNGTSTLTIDLANESGGFLNTSSTSEPSGVFTPVASAEVADAALNQVNTAAHPTATGGGTWDLTKPTFTSVAPANSATISSITTSSAVNYTLSEALGSGTITMTQTGGVSDGASPHTCTLVGTALNTGAHTGLDMSNTTNGCTVAQSLVGNAIYTFDFDGTDGAGNKATTVSRTSVTFAGPPAVTTVSASTADGTYKAGDTVHVTVTFDKSVTVVGSPRLQLETGVTDEYANYVSGSPGTVLTFDYVVSPGDTATDLDYLSTGALTLNGGTINDTTLSTAADLTLVSPGAAGSLGANKNIVIDTTAPTLTSVTIYSDNVNADKAKVGDTVTVSFTSDEAIQTPTVTIDGVGATVLGGPTVWTASTVMSPTNTEAALGFTIDFADLVGNNGTTVTTVTDASSVTFDQTTPTIVSLTSTASPGPTNTSPIPMTVTFSEPVTGLTEGEFVVGNGSVDALSLAGGPTVYTFTVTPSAPPGPSTITVDLGSGTVQDLAGNANTDTATQLSIVFDSANPTVTLSSTNVTGDPTNVSPMHMEATFSQDVTGFIDTDVGDIVVGNGTLSNFVAVDASHYTFDITPTAQGTVTVDVPGGVATDLATNPNLAATQFSVGYDSIAPSVTGAVMKDTDGDGKVDRLTLTFDEALADTASGSNGFDVTSASSHGSCDSEVADPDGTTTLDVDFLCDTADTAVDDLTLSITPNAGVADAAGNQVSFAALSGASITDGAAPVVLSTTTPADGDIGVLFGAPLVVNFSEKMNTGSFTVSDDDTNNYTGTVWNAPDNTSVTLTHDDWTPSATVAVTVGGNDDAAGLALNTTGSSPSSFAVPWSFTIHGTGNLGQIPETTSLDGSGTGIDLSTGVSTATGGNVFINGVSQPLSTVTSGDITGADLTGPQTVGDQSVTPVQAVTLNSTGTIDLTNPAMPGVDVSIPNNTTLFGCAGWNGSLSLNPGSNGGNAPSGFSVGGNVIEVGSSFCPLLLDKPVTIILTGMTGDIAYRPAGSSNWFTISACAGTYASPVAPAAPPPFNECAISNGADTKIVTYHFTAFGPLLPVAAPGPTGQGGGAAPNYSNGGTSGQITAVVTPSAVNAPAESQPHPAALVTPPCELTSSSSVPFTDISGDANKIYIEDLYRKCAVSGKTQTSFASNDSVTRAELAKALVVYDKLGTTNFVNYFDDVKEGDWFASYMLQAVKLGVINMQSVNNENRVILRPNDHLTRAEALSMALKAKGINVANYDKNVAFVDVGPHDWFNKLASYAQNQQLMTGNTMTFAKGGMVGKLYKFPRLLGLGDKGKDVRNLKMVMMQMDYYSGEINDNYDAGLAAAVVVYQKAYRLLPSGNMGALMRSKLVKEYLSPKTVSYFRPYDQVTRSDAAKLVYMANKLESSSVLGASTTRFLQNLRSGLVSMLSFVGYLQ